MPTKIIEALACGKHTIATPVAARSVPHEFKRLQVVETDQFPKAICGALKADKMVSDVDFENLKAKYSWRTNIMKLADKIETEI